MSLPSQTVSVGVQGNGAEESEETSEVVSVGEESVDVVPQAGVSSKKHGRKAAKTRYFT